MIVEINNAKVSIFWKHYNDHLVKSEIEGTEDQMFHEPFKRTCCKVTIENTNDPAVNITAEACATLSNNDQFNRRIGRELSLKRALDKLRGPDGKHKLLTEEERRIIWHTYGKSCKQDWANKLIEA